MKNTTILTHEKQGVFNLNGKELSRQELILLLELLDFEASFLDDDQTFFENSQISLQSVTQQDFEKVYEDFLIWKGISDFEREVIYGHGNPSIVAVNV